jgi:hypothetical protein
MLRSLKKQKMKAASVRKSTLFIPMILFLLISSCSNHADYLTQAQNAFVKSNVQQMTDSIAKNVSDKGPVAWLLYFENTPGFFMASEGQLKFSNHDSASNFINTTLVKSIHKIELHWSTVRIDPLTNKLASIGAFFHEDITDISGKKIPVDGYFTGIAHLTSQGWKLRNAHWSVIH